MKRGFNSGRTGNRKSSGGGGGGSGEANVQANWLQSTTTDDAYILNKPNVQYTSAIANATSSVTGLATSTQITKLDGIESSATADQTNLEIKTAYETNADTNEFSDAEQTKLGGIATSANNYSHPTGDGNLHVPATSTTNDGKVLTAGATAGSLSWQTPSGGGGGGGVWTEISSTTVSTAVSQVEFSITGYTIYKLFYYGVNWGTNDNNFAIKITVGSAGTYSETMRFVMHRFGGGSSANQHSLYGGTGSVLEMWPGLRVDSSNGSNFGEITIFNTVGQPTIKVDDCLMDDTSSVSAGITHAIAGLSSPASTATIGKIKCAGSQGNNIEAGTFALYGLTIS